LLLLLLSLLSRLLLLLLLTLLVIQPLHLDIVLLLLLLLVVMRQGREDRLSISSASKERVHEDFRDADPPVRVRVKTLADEVETLAGQGHLGLAHPAVHRVFVVYKRTFARHEDAE
jgi:hypothetical protein